MGQHFVTLFDSLYLPQGMALHESMEKHVQDYTLWVLCCDETTYVILSDLNLRNVKLQRLVDLETEELKSIKPTRSKGEYYWTLTPFTPDFVFNSNPDVDQVTYIDADIWFMKSPEDLFNEFEETGKAILITDHAYSKMYDKSKKSGRYCVQFLVFKRIESEYIRRRWQSQCLEWCYDRFEDGKFGDQKYLDEWPELFPESVHVLKNIKLTLAPWNAVDGDPLEAAFYHFHRVRIRSKEDVFIGPYLIPKTTFEMTYREYGKQLKRILNLLENKYSVNIQQYDKLNWPTRMYRLFNLFLKRGPYYERETYSI